MSVVAVLVILSSIPLYKAVQLEFTPSDVDEGEFEIRFTGPEGTSLAAIDEVMRAIEAELQADARRAARCWRPPAAGSSARSTAARSTSGSRRTRSATSRSAGCGARRSTARRWTRSRELHAERREDRDPRPDAQVPRRPRLRSATTRRSTSAAGTSRSTSSSRARSSNRSRATPRRCATSSSELGIVDADTTLKLNKPELRVDIDRERAADLGVSSRDIGTALRLMVGGDTEVSRFRDPATNEDYDVQLRLSEADRSDPNEIPRLFLPRAGGGLVELQNLATLRTAESPSRIDRLDRQRAANLRAAAVAPGYALADRMDAISAAADELNMPPGYTTAFLGRGRELERTFTEFVWAFLLSIIFMYMILASNYESLVHPLTILLSLPLSIPFALLSLWATGETLNLYSALGILVLFGVVKKNSILQIDHMNHLRDDMGMPPLRSDHPGQPRPPAADPDDDARASSPPCCRWRWAPAPARKSGVRWRSWSSAGRRCRCC